MLAALKRRYDKPLTPAFIHTAEISIYKAKLHFEQKSLMKVCTGDSSSSLCHNCFDLLLSDGSDEGSTMALIVDDQCQ